MKIVRKVVSLDDYKKKLFGKEAEIHPERGEQPVTLAIDESPDGRLHIHFHNEWAEVNISGLHMSREAYETFDRHVRDVMEWD
jgi:hypothetical protein